MPPADHEQQFSVEIAGTPLDCFTIITDFERYPEWSSPIRHARVLERDRAGVGRVVEYHIDMRFKTLRYVLEYRYKKPTDLTWQSVDGDVESIEGAYQFRKVGPQRTEASCRQAIALGFWVPGPLRSLAERTALRQSVLEFKAEVERRLAASQKPKTASRGAKAAR